MKYSLLLLFSSLFFFQCSTSENKTEKEETTSEEKASGSLASFGIDETKPVPKGLAVGSYAPGIGARDIKGNSFDLFGDLKDGPIVMIFYRGNWCPVCSKYMSNLNDSISYITSRGAQIVAVTPETTDDALEFAKKTNTGFSVISDGRYAIIDAFEVGFHVTSDYQDRLGKDLAQYHKSKEPRLPVPATYIIDKSGRIIYRHFSYDYSDRATVKEILHNLPE